MSVLRRLAASATIVTLAASPLVAAPTAHAAATGYTTADLTVRSAATSGSTALTHIPSGAAVSAQCQMQGEAVNGTYNTNWWAKVTYNGKTGYVSRAYLRIPDATGLTTCSSTPATKGVAGYVTELVTIRTGSNTGTTALTQIPAGTKVTVQCQVQGEAVNGTYNTNWWAKVSYNGKTGFATRAYIRIPDATGLTTCSSGGGGTKPGTSTINGSISRDEIISRAMFWVNKRVPYSMQGWAPDPQGKSYRTDCSGMVSMALHLDTSLSTVTLPARVREISPSSLTRGDIVGNLGPNTAGAAGHVMIFNGWVDGSHTKFRTLEETGGVGANARIRTWGDSKFTQHAYRYTKVAG